MNNLLILFTGELQRLQKYNILTASFLAALIWVGVLHFTRIENISSIFPLLIFVDATMMSMLMVGVTMFFEKQEGVLKTLLVSPITKLEYITAKTCANIVSNIITLFILYLYARIFKEISVNILALLGAALLIAFFHSLIGFILTYNSRDFTEMLMGMMKYTLILGIPVLLEQVGLIKNEIIVSLLSIIPTRASMLLLKASAGGLEAWKIALSIFYLLAGSYLLYLFVAKKFDEFAVKESGV